MNPDQPPRVRLEWLIATARLVIASSAFVTFTISPLHAANAALNVALACYVGYSLLLLGVVWRPARFGAGWDLAVHLFDLAAFSVLLLLTATDSSPFYVYFTFLVICGTLRWQWKGALGTAAAAIAVYFGVNSYAVTALGVDDLGWNTLIVRSVNVAVVASLAGYLGAYQDRHQREIGRLVAWSRRIPPDEDSLIEEILAESALIFECPRVLLAWQEPHEPRVNFAWRSNGVVAREEDPARGLDALVEASLADKNFYADDAADASGTIVFWSGDAFRQRTGSPLDPALQRKFAMHAVQSWALDGEVIRGRLFCLDRRQMREDDLMFGSIVARQAVSRLDSLHLLKRLRETAADEERLRLARDLHDSLLQSVAGAALQLLAARRLLSRDPATAARRLEEVQTQLERGELEMRSFIGRLRPLPVVNPLAGGNLRSRLEQLRQRVQREWQVNVKVQVAAAADAWPESVASEVYRLVQEGVLNAARHADASLVTVKITGAGGPCMEIVDDGCGFPFRGTYDLAKLTEMNAGPLTLRERVAGLSGDLHLRSSDTGTQLLIRLPAMRAAG